MSCPSISANLLTFSIIIFQPIHLLVVLAHPKMDEEAACEATPKIEPEVSLELPIV